MSRLFEKYQINIWMYGYSPIQGTRSRFLLKVRDRFVPLLFIFFGPCPLEPYIQMLIWYCQNKISVYACSPIQGTKFYSCWNLMKQGFQSGTYVINWFKIRQKAVKTETHELPTKYILLNKKEKIRKKVYLCCPMFRPIFKTVYPSCWTVCPICCES